jgi:triosephosphate isomerase (TIM)
MRKYLIAGNWKMNTTAEEAMEISSKIKAAFPYDYNKIAILLCPPFTSIHSVSGIIQGTSIALGGQNCYYEPKGAFTGEISINMLGHLGCSHIIVGHSERRKYFHENDDIINKKAIAVLSGNLKPIICIGETLEERQEGKTFDILQTQLEQCLKNISTDNSEKITIAYEPVWAIGTGLAATPAQIAEAHHFIRQKLIEIFPVHGQQILIQYGGSVDSSNCKSILGIENVGGALVGGASLKPDVFIDIIKSAEFYVGV